MDQVTGKPMESALREWVRDVATEFGFKRGWVHHGDISRTPWFGYYVAWRTLVIVTKYKKTSS